MINKLSSVCWVVHVKPRGLWLGSGEREFIAGRYYFQPGAPAPISRHGCSFATFETRAEARQAIARLNKWTRDRSVHTPVRVRFRVEVMSGRGK